MSGATIGGIAGAVIGGFFGAPQLGYAVGTIVGGAIDPEHIQGTRLGEISVQTSSEGIPRPIPYGSPEPFAGNLMMAGPHIRVIKEERQSGKGGPVVENEEVYQTYAIRICEGRTNGVQVIQVWRDGKMVLDRTGLNLIDAEGIQFQTKALFYPGDEAQLPDPSLESLPIENGGGVGNVPAHRGTCYMVVINDNLTGTGGRIPTYHFRVSSNATVTTSCTEEGLFFWYPLDDYNGPGSTAREVINGWNGIYVDPDPPVEEALVSIGPALTVGGLGSMALLDKRGYMYADLGADNLALLDKPAWSISSVSVVLDEVEGGTVFKNIATWWNDLASGYHGWSMGYSGSPANMTPYAGVGLGDGSNVNLSAGGPAGGTFTQYIVLTWESHDGNPAGLGSMYLYLNGALIASNLSCHNSSRTSTLLTVGGAEYPNSYGLIGYVADIKGYNYALTPTEVRIKASGVGPSTDFWPLPDSPGSFVDAQGNKFTPCTSSATINAETLASIKLDIALRCGISADEMDVEAAEDILVDGFLIGKQVQGQAPMRQLDQAYFGDSPEYDGQIHWVQRGAPAVREITDAEFFFAPPEDRIGRRQMIELPKGVNLAYSDPAQNYARGIAPYRRQSRDVPAESVVELEFPLVFDRAVAFQKAEIWMKQEWEAAEGKLERSLPFYAHADLVPSDCFTNNGRRYRLIRAEVTDGVMQIEALRDRVRNYASAAVGSVPLDPTAPVSSLKGPTVFTALNLPRLTSAQNSPGMVLAGTGLLPGWPGAIIYRSVDEGLTWQIVGSLDRRATMGRLTADATESSEPISLEVFDNRDLSTITAAQMALRLNGFAITTDELSEVGQFMTAQEGSSGDWDIFDVLRGQLETDAALHYTGDDFLLLDDALFFDRIDASYAGRPIMYRPVTRGTPIENNPTYTVIFLPQFTGPENANYYVDESADEYVDEFGSRYFETD